MEKTMKNPELTKTAHAKDKEKSTDGMYRFLWEVTVQGAAVQGMYICKSNSRTEAEKMMKTAVFRHFQFLGTWKTVDEESKVPLGVCRSDVRTVKELDADEFSHPHYPVGELYPAEIYGDDILSSNKRKRRTSNEVALDKRKAKRKKIEEREEKKKEKKERKKRSASIDRKEALQKVLDYFSSEPKQMTQATKDLQLQYQKVRYFLFLIRDKGFNGNDYELKESQIDNNKAFQLVKK